jgi:hypothetical protein
MRKNSAVSRLADAIDLLQKDLILGYFLSSPQRHKWHIVMSSFQNKITCSICFNEKKLCTVLSTCFIEVMLLSTIFFVPLILCTSVQIVLWYNIASNIEVMRSIFYPLLFHIGIINFHLSVITLGSLLFVLLLLILYR